MHRSYFRLPTKHTLYFLNSVRAKSLLSSSIRQFAVMPAKKQENGTENNATKTVHPRAHQFQAGDSTNRDIDAWKHRDPYRIHEEDEEFPVKWRGGCHCGKIKYKLSREKPLACKYCHCTTCQRLHGVRYSQHQ